MGGGKSEHSPPPILFLNDRGYISFLESEISLAVYLGIGLVGGVR